MATKKIRKPALKKYPKKPKASASVDSMEKYLATRKDVDKENARRMNEYEKALKELDNMKKKKATLQKHISGLAGTPSFKKGKR